MRLERDEVADMILGAFGVLAFAERKEVRESVYLADQVGLIHALRSNPGSRFAITRPENFWIARLSLSL
jgi:hypothetical protein